VSRLGALRHLPPAGSIMPITFQTKVTTGTVVAILIVAIMCGLSYRNILVSERERTWVIHTHTVLENLDDLLDNAVRVEADHRGYIWSGDEGYAASFALDEHHLEGRLDQIRLLTTDNAAQQKSVAELKSCLDGLRRGMERRMQLRRNAGKKAGIEA